MDAADAGEAVVAAMTAGGVEILFFTSGSELAFYQEAIAKARASTHLPIVVDVPTIAGRSRFTESVACAAVAANTSRSRSTCENWMMTFCWRGRVPTKLHRARTSQPSARM